MKKQILSPLLAALLLSGCTLIPDYERPSMDVPAGWTGAESDTPVAIARDWWTNFNSAELNDLMTRALIANTDLNAAVARVEQARGLARAAGAPLLPSVDATGSLGYERVNPGEGEDTDDAVGRAGLGIAYELDLFGQNRANRTAALADVETSEFNRDAIALIVMADTARAYFNVLNLQERMSVWDQNVESARDLLRIVQARFDAGATTALDVAQQKADLSNTEATRAAIERELNFARSALAVITGQPPQSLRVEAKTLTGLLVPPIAAGQPSALLERRPDIRADVSALLAANADIGAARAAFFPDVTLGLDWTVLASPLGDPATTTLALASSVAAPIFSGGLLEGNLAFSKARKQELVEDYRKTVLVSFKEVEDALAATKAAQQRESALQNAFEESRKAYDLSRQQYDAGAIDFQTLLDTRRTMLTAQDNYIQTRNERLAAAVDLYKALGGGWADDAAEGAQQKPAAAAVPEAKTEAGTSPAPASVPGPAPMFGDEEAKPENPAKTE